jgi:hypothetical protein
VPIRFYKPGNSLSLILFRLILSPLVEYTMPRSIRHDKTPRVSSGVKVKTNHHVHSLRLLLPNSFESSNGLKTPPNPDRMLRH